MDEKVNDPTNEPPEAAENRALGTANGECIMLQCTKVMHGGALRNA
jgi:hypothetical protein